MDFMLNSVGATDKHSNMVINTKFIDSQSPGEFADSNKRDRFERVSEIDRSCRQAMVSEGRTFAETVDEIEQFLPEGETIKATLKIVAVRNLPSKLSEDAETAVGRGWLAITVSPDGNARLHIAMSTEDAKFDAEEVWLQQTSGCLCCQKRNRQVRARYASSHTQSLQVTTLNCLFSPSSHLVDTSDLEVYFGTQAVQKVAKPIQRHPSGVRTQSGCLWPTKQGMWQKEVAFQHDLQKMMEKSLISVNDQASYKFPDIDAVQDKEERCQRIAKHQLVSFQYVAAEGTLETFEAWTSQDESMVKVMRFALSLSLLCTEVAPPDHIDHSHGEGLLSFPGVAKVGSAKKPLKLFKPSPHRRRMPSLDKKRSVQCLCSTVLLGIILYVVFAVVLPRLQVNRTIGLTRFNNSTMI